MVRYLTAIRSFICALGRHSWSMVRVSFRLFATSCGGPHRGRPGFDFCESFAEVACFFVDKAFEVVAHAEAIEIGVGFVVPLRKPGEELDQAGEQGDEPGIVAAAELGLNADVVGADGLGLLQVIVACPADDQRSVGAFAMWEADPSFLGYVEFSTKRPVTGSTGRDEVGASVLGWNQYFWLIRNRSQAIVTLQYSYIFIAGYPNFMIKVSLKLKRFILG